MRMDKKGNATIGIKNPGYTSALTAEILDAMIDGVTITSIQGEIITINRAMAKQTGYEKEEVIGKNAADILASKKDQAAFLAHREILTAGKPIAASEFLAVRKDGTEYPVSASLSLLRDTDGKPNAVVAVSRDITRQKQLEQELQLQNEQLETQNEELRAINEELRATEEELRVSNEELQAANEELKEAEEQLIRSEKLAAIGQLAGGVGHELRNPLGAIKNAAYYIRGKLVRSELAQAEPRIMEFMNIIDEEINSSNKIINDLLGFSRVGKPTVFPARLEPVINDTISRLTIPENIRLTRKFDLNLPDVEVDAKQIGQVLVNVITNAIQAMPDGGRLTISTRQTDPFAEIKVTDTGHGIAPEVLDKIFNPLFTTRAKGIGLGLAVCKTIIDRHGGQISVESQTGQGTTFTIKLPLPKEQHEPEVKDEKNKYPGS